MATKDFTTTILVDQSPEEVFNAICNVHGWWQGEINGSTNKLYDEFTYRFEEIHFSKQRLVEVTPGKKVVWLVTESQLSFLKDKSEWTNTLLLRTTFRVELYERAARARSQASERTRRHRAYPRFRKQE